jgi:hypothetical protein
VKEGVTEFASLMELPANNTVLLMDHSGYIAFYTPDLATMAKSIKLEIQNLQAAVLISDDLMLAVSNSSLYTYKFSANLLTETHTGFTDYNNVK